MLYVRGKSSLVQELNIFIFYTFHNVFAESLWHFWLEYKDVELQLNLLATFIYLKIKFYLNFGGFTIFLSKLLNNFLKGRILFSFYIVSEAKM